MATGTSLIPVGSDGQRFAQKIESALLNMVPRLLRHYPCLEDDDVLIDMLEEAGQRILRHERLNEPIARLHGYAWVTLRSVAVSYARRSASRLRSRTISSDNGGPLLRDVHSRLGTAEQMEHAILVGELLAKLTPSERQLCLWKREGLSSAEIARLRGGTATAVDSLWFRIRKKIVMTFP